MSSLDLSRALLSRTLSSRTPPSRALLPSALVSPALLALLLQAMPVQQARAADLGGVAEVLTEFPVRSAPESSAVVTITQMKYDKAEIHVKAGEVVTWVNRDALPHNIQFRPGVLGDKGLQGPMISGAHSYAIRFKQPGTYDYFCTPHPFMKGKVVVE